MRSSVTFWIGEIDQAAQREAGQHRQRVRHRQHEMAARGAAPQGSKAGGGSRLCRHHRVPDHPVARPRPAGVSRPENTRSLQSRHINLEVKRRAASRAARRPHCGRGGPGFAENHPRPYLDTRVAGSSHITRESRPALLASHVKTAMPPRPARGRTASRWPSSALPGDSGSYRGRQSTCRRHIMMRGRRDFIVTVAPCPSRRTRARRRPAGAARPDAAGCRHGLRPAGSRLVSGRSALHGQDRSAPPHERAPLRSRPWPPGQGEPAQGGPRQADLQRRQGPGSNATRHDWFFALALAVRDRLVDGWMTTTRTIYDARPQAGLLSQPRVPDRPPARRLPAQSRPHTRRRARPWASSASMPRRCSRSSPTPPWAMAASAGSPPACSTAWRPWASPPSATASATSTACSSRASTTAGRSSGPRTGWPSATPGSSSAPESVYPVRFYGQVREERDAAGRRVHVWEGGQRVLAVAYDTPVVGWGGRHDQHAAPVVGAERQPDRPRGLQPRRLHARRAGAGRCRESISRVLYPNDATEAGQELRLKQEYFFTRASLQDIIRRHLSYHPDLRSLPDKAAIQLNDTHPAIAVPELMRLLIDEHGLDWQAGLGDHPRHHPLHQPHADAGGAGALAGAADGAAAAAPSAAHLRDQRPRPERAARRGPTTTTRSSADVSIIDEGYGRFVRMGHLAFLGARRVNGVSALHGELMKQTVFRTAAPAIPRPDHRRSPTASPRAAGCWTATRAWPS